MLPTRKQELSILEKNLKELIQNELKYTLGREPYIATNRDWLSAVCLVARDHMIDKWFSTIRSQVSQQHKQVYYLSMEFLMGRTLSNALISMGIYKEMGVALASMGLDLETLINEESDPGLGNGGLGRLAACFMDSLAAQRYPAWGYGLRYRYGMFKQGIVNGQQVELSDNWLEYGCPWEFARRHARYKVHFGGRLQLEGTHYRWVEYDTVLACAYDQVIPGYENGMANTLRLWEAQASSEMNLDKFNQGDYLAAVQDKNFSENITRVLYPNDSTDSGRELRLRQEYFLVSATVQDILKRHWFIFHTYENLADKIAIHLNDTHPVLAIPEMMRILVDELEIPWQKAWKMTEKIFSYTNHTLMPEALETWSVNLLGQVLPRHLQIIFDINENFLGEVKKVFPEDEDLISRVSLIDESNGRRVRMAWLAVVASHKINGVSKLHSELMKSQIFADFAKIYPERFTNKTNGITPRRWLAIANPKLSDVVDRYIGKKWRVNLQELEQLKEYIDYPSFLRDVEQSKHENKEILAHYLAENMNIFINPFALFDVQIKRIHEYKRQLLNVLHVITRYNRIVENPNKPWVPRVVIFAGKAASSYVMAKLIIRLINDVADKINQDPRIQKKLKVVFIPNYSVSLAQMIIPATDLSEQISLAGTEASGTGNMKFALNGALTIGTLDGANVEIREQVGDENIFIFGNNAEQVKTLFNKGYNPREYYEGDLELQRVLNQIGSGFFNPQDPTRYSMLFDSLINFGDHYQLLADYRSYIETQDKIDQLYAQPDLWATKVVNNIANMGIFSSDRTIDEYANDIWNIKPVEH